MYTKNDPQHFHLSLVIPVFNEAPNILPLSRRILRILPALAVASAEVIFVDDGSEDETSFILQRLCDPLGPWRAIYLPNNEGKTAAIDAGFKAAMGDLIVTMDGDMQNDPADIPKLIDQLVPEVGCVTGYRVWRHDNWIRRWSSIIANSVRNWVLNEKFRDSGCGFKLIRKSVIDQIQLYEGLHRFLPTMVRSQGWRVVEVPVRHHQRKAGKSKYSIRNRLFRTLMDLYAVRWMKLRSLRYQTTSYSGKLK